jgi:hypothetical protein
MRSRPASIAFVSGISLIVQAPRHSAYSERCGLGKFLARVAISLMISALIQRVSALRRHSSRAFRQSVTGFGFEFPKRSVHHG